MTRIMPRRFHLRAGDSRIADGVQWPDGTVAIRSTGDSHRSTTAWLSMDHAEQSRAYGAHVDIVWDDPAHIGRDQADLACPHCPDGHTPPTGGSQPWAAYLAPQRDGDGQPTLIHVGRTGGAHVAESDAAWVRNRLNHP